MAGVNKVILLGHLGKDPDVKKLDSGKSVANFSLATSEVYKNKEGEKHWCVVQYRNITPPQPINSWNFETKKEAEDFMRKNNMSTLDNQN